MLCIPLATTVLSRRKCWLCDSLVMWMPSSCREQREPTDTVVREGYGDALVVHTEFRLTVLKFREHFKASVM